MGSRTSQEAPQEQLILDSGVVIALSRNDHRARAYLEQAIEDRMRLRVPAVVVAETVRGRGPRDALVNRVLASVEDIVPATEQTARIAGGLLGKARSGATVDSLVVATAIEQRGDVILTTDPSDIRSLVPRGSRLQIHSI
jgi:predicted nucleic acid-binding protein